MPATLRPHRRVKNIFAGVLCLAVLAGGGVVPVAAADPETSQPPGASEVVAAPEVDATATPEASPVPSPDLTVGSEYTTPSPASSASPVAVPDAPKAVLASDAPTVTAASATGPVAWWPLDDAGATVTDLVGSATGEVRGGDWVSGHSGGALSTTTAGDGVRVEDQVLLAPGALSVEGWIRGTGTHAEGEVILASGWAACGLNSYSLTTGSVGGLRFALSDGVGQVATAESAPVWDGNWHHVAGTFGGSLITLFVDGTAVSPSTEVGAFEPAYGLPDTSLWIAGAPALAEGCEAIPQLAGDIDEVRLWDRALAPDEVAALAANGRVATTVTLGAPSQVQVGMPTTVAAAVDPVPSGGSVEFVDVSSGSDILATADVDASGLATVDVRFVTLGRHIIEARFSGTPTFLASTSATAAVTVVKHPLAPGQTDLGTTALNGNIQALITDPQTGITYAGGDFTRVGPRTGPLAMIEGPEVGTSAAIDSDSPEVVGTINNAIDDGAGGVIVVGELVAIDSTPVPLANGYPTPVVRISGDGRPDWSWVAGSKGLECAGLGGKDNLGALNGTTRAGRWIVAPAPRARVDTARGTSSTGLMFLDPATGATSLSGSGTAVSSDGTACSRIWSSIPPLPQIIGCAWCYADIRALAYNPASDVLVVGYSFMKNIRANEWDNSLVLAGYDVSHGTRLWTRQVPKAGAVNAFASSIVSVGNRVLVYGSLPFESGTEPTWDHVTQAALLDPTTGTTVQRWTVAGEVAIGNPLGSVVPSTVPPSCNPARVAGQFSHPGNDGPNVLVGTGSYTNSASAAEASICRWTLDGAGRIASEQLGSMTVPWGNTQFGGFPNVVYHRGAESYVLSPYGAFDLRSRRVTGWNPDPAAWNSGGTFVDTGSHLFIAGPFSFLHGRPAEHLVAFDAAMDPISSFDAAADRPVGALELWRGRLVLGGEFATVDGAERSGLAAVDPRTGALDPWAPDASGRSHGGMIDSLSVDPVTQAMYVAGVSCIDHWSCRGDDTPALVRYHDIEAGGALDGSWHPSFTCITPKTNDTQLTRCPDVTISAVEATGDKIYVGGDFSKVDGESRQALARFDAATGTLDAWAPDIYSQMAVPANGELFSIHPRRIVVSSGRALVGGDLSYWTPSGGGAGQVYQRSPLVVLDASSGARVYPDPAGGLTANFPVVWAGGGYDVSFYGSAVVVALGRQGAVVLDASTFKFDPTGNPFMASKWWATSEGVFALSGVTAPPAAVAASSFSRVAQMQAQVTALVATPSSALLGGGIPRWENRTAGNLIEAAVPVPDGVAPVAHAPQVVPATGASLTSSTARLKVSWAPALETGSGIKAYALQSSRDGGAWKSVSLSKPTTTAASVTATLGHAYRFRLRATDLAGNVGSWIVTPSERPRLVQQTATPVRYSRGWTSAALSGSSGGSVKYAKRAGSTARFAFTGRAISWVSTTSPSRGSARVYIDGVLVTTVSTRSASHTKRVVFSKAFSGFGSHTITIKTVSGARVDVDAFVVLK